MNVQELDERVARKVKLDTPSADSLCRKDRVTRPGFPVGVFQFYLLRAAAQRRSNKTGAVRVRKCGYGGLASD
jgi:hypothetical protein